MIIGMKDVSIDQCSEAAAAAYLRQVRQFLVDGKKNQREGLLRLEGLHSHFLGQIEGLPRTTISPKALSYLLEDVFQKQIDWVQAFQAYGQNASPTELAKRWRMAFSDFVTSLRLPESLPESSPDSSPDLPQSEIERFLPVHMERSLSALLLKLSRQLLRETALIFDELHREDERWLEHCLIRKRFKSLALKRRRSRLTPALKS